MLTDFLYLSAIWFFLSFIAVIFTRKIRSGNLLGAVFWLILILFIGAVLWLTRYDNFNELVFLSLITFLIGTGGAILLPDWNITAKVAFPLTAQVSVLYLIYSFSISAFQTANVLGFILAMFFFLIEFAALMLSLSYAYEAFDTLCRVRWRTIPKPDKNYFPKVTFQIPCYNEPPKVVAKTLDSLSRLDYPNYEVLVIDNNTKDENNYLPIRDKCIELGKNFRFYHIDNWPGFKSGALNFALSVTPKDSELIAVVDADYEVKPNFLKDLAGYFKDPKIAFVQTPQDYEHDNLNSFFETAYLGYKYFFEISMRSRNQHNAIIFAGTMGIIRKKVLQEIGGWDEWCITEDAEASLRILKLGYSSLFINKTYGKGLMPLTFDGFKKQRFRWCFGGIQILKRHWEALMPWSNFLDKDNHLSFAQKYYYLVGALQWYNDLLNLLFAFFLILGGILSLMPEIRGFRPFTEPLLIMPAVFLLVGIWRFLWVLKNALKLSLGKALVTMANFFSLGWAVTLGSVQGLIQKKGVFLRTPKTSSNLKILSALSSTPWEIYIGLICLGASLFFIFYKISLPTISYSIMLFWESLLFLSAPIFSLISLHKVSPYVEVTYSGPTVSEKFAATGVIFTISLLSLAVGLWFLLPRPTQPASYSRFQPPPAPPVVKEDISLLKIKVRPSATPSVSPTPTLTPAVTDSVKETPTNSPSGSPTPTPQTASPSATLTPSPATASPSATSTPAASPSATIAPKI